MVRHFVWALGVLLVTVVPVQASADCDQKEKRDKVPAVQQAQARPRWWQEPKLRQELGITDQQCIAIEQIFSSSIPSLRDARKELDQLEAVLSRTIQENTADLFTVSQQVDRVEAVRSASNKARTVMLYRINLVLSPDQRVKVKAVNDRYEEQRRKDDDERRKQDKGRGRH
jgi:hypothetical protein